VRSGSADGAVTNGSIVRRAILDTGAHCFLEKGAQPDVITNAIKEACAAGRRGASPLELREANA
jgi:DNA-binding NarL/FixJ family response regulator